jgi:hypothetical protein
MSLDFYLYGPPVMVCPTVLDKNITHNLGKMADAAGIYKCLWRPDENGFKMAKDIIPALTAGLKKLKKYPAKFKKLDAPNGWGTYEHFVPWVEEVLRACEANPEATIEVSR